MGHGGHAPNFAPSGRDLCEFVRAARPGSRQPTPYARATWATLREGAVVALGFWHVDLRLVGRSVRVRLFVLGPNAPVLSYRLGPSGRFRAKRSGRV